MVSQAVDLLQKEIQEHPTNAEAHLELGNIYLQQGNYNAAGERFKGAIGLKAGLKGEVGGKCTQVGYSMMDSGRIDEAFRVLNMAVMFDPSLKSEIGKKMGQTGDSLMASGKNKAAIHAFNMAAQFDPSIREAAGEKFAQAGYDLLNKKNPAATDEALLVFETAQKFKPELKKKIDEKIMAIADDYYNQAMQVKIRPCGLMPKNERQDLINALAQKAELLAKACQYADRYKGEHQECSNLMTMEKNVLVTIEKLGEPKFVHLGGSTQNGNSSTSETA